MRIDNGYPVAEGHEIVDDMSREAMQNGVIMNVDPELFLLLTPRPEWWTGYGSSYQRIRDRIDAERPLDIPYIHIWSTNINHEGRHRALACIDLGIENMPVAILKENPTEEEINYLSSLEKS